MFWGPRERIGALQPLKKHRNYLSFCMPALYGGFLVNSMKFIENQEIQWNCRNFMKIMKFHEIHWFSGFRDPSRNLCIPCSKSRSERLGPPKTYKTAKTIILIKITKFPTFCAKFLEICKIMQKSVFGGFWCFPGRHMLNTLLFL